MIALARLLQGRLALLISFILLASLIFITSTRPRQPWPGATQCGFPEHYDTVPNAPLTYASHERLSTKCAPGRLANRIFQNAAVSFVAERLDLATEYGYDAECRRLGLPFYSGSRTLALSEAREVLLSEALLESSYRQKMCAR